MEGWSLVALVLIGYALLARRLDRWSITAPIVMVLAGTILGSGYLDVLPTSPGTEPIRLITELTLAVILFADASTVKLRQAEGDFGLPLRLLGVGLPLTIALGALAAHLLFPSMSWAQAGLIGAILAPTDAALGVAVVSNPVVPARIRRALNIESGLNDGIATPIVTVLVAVVVAGAAHRHWAAAAVLELARGAGVGIAAGLIGGWLVHRSKAVGWTTPTSEDLMALSLALFCFGAAVHYSGNGFVAAFVAGLVFGASSHGEEERATEFADTAGMFSSFLVWIIFGAGFVGPVLRAGIHLRPIAYAVLSLTLVRMVPVALSLVGRRLRRDTVGFIGWFGPRGLASVVFTLIAFDALEGHELAHALTELTTWTILLSVVAHGLSSGPLATWYGNRLRDAAADTPELVDVSPTRFRTRSL